MKLKFKTLETQGFKNADRVLTPHQTGWLLACFYTDSSDSFRFNLLSQCPLQSP